MNMFRRRSPPLVFGSDGVREKVLWNFGQIRVIVQPLAKEPHLRDVRQREVFFFPKLQRVNEQMM